MASRPDASGDLLPTRGPLRARRAKRVERLRGLFSPGVVIVASMLSVLHLINFLNYTRIGVYFNPPMTRSILLTGFVLLILVRHSRNLPFHISRCWDVYAICLLAIVSVAYSLDPTRSLKYGLWLLLSVYVGTELAARIRQPSDLVVSLCIVFLPATLLVTGVNLALGPVVESTGREFGALGSAHVDTAYAMNFVCMFLALRSMPVRTVRLPKWLRWGMWIAMLWAAHRIIFGLTRSVWLGVAMSLGLFTFRRSLNVRALLGTLFLITTTVIVIDYVGLDRVLPAAVKDRIEVTERRIESGQIDPRLQAIERAYNEVLQNPFGTGYAVSSSHNSYLNFLVNLGWLGFGLAVLAIGRSVVAVWRAGFNWVLFFSIGAAPLLLHAFFEVQNWPGQANFVPLLLWYAMSRARFRDEIRVQPPRGRAPVGD